MRCHVGGRKSYGTAPNTLPCHVRSAAGLDSSVATAATTRPRVTTRTRRRIPRKLRILQLKRSTRVTLHVFHTLFQAGEMARRLPSTGSWLRWLTPGLHINRWLLLPIASHLLLVPDFPYPPNKDNPTFH